MSEIRRLCCALLLGSGALIDPGGECLVQGAEPRYFPVDKNRNWGVIDATGQVIVEPIYRRIVRGDKASGQIFALSGEGWLEFAGKQIIKRDVFPDDTQDAAYAGDGICHLIRARRGIFDAVSSTVDVKEQLKLPEGFSAKGFLRDGLLPVGKDEKWGFADRSGKLVIAAQFEDVWSFSDGLGRIKVDGKWGYCDREGKIVVAPKYRIAGDFSEELAPVIDEMGPAHIDRTGKVVIRVKDAIYVGPFSEGRALFRVPGGPYGKGGFIDRTGRIVVPAKYSFVTNFSQGLAGFYQRDEGPAGWPGGYIDKSGKEVISFPNISEVQPFEDGLAWVKSSDHGGYIDRKGRWIWKWSY